MAKENFLAGLMSADKPQAEICPELLAPAVQPHSSSKDQEAHSVAKVKGQRQDIVITPDQKITALAHDACICLCGKTLSVYFVM